MNNFNTRKFKTEDAKEVSELIIKTLRTTNIKDYTEEFIENDVKRFTPDEKTQHQYSQNFSLSSVTQIS